MKHSLVVVVAVVVLLATVACKQKKDESPAQTAAPPAPAAAPVAPAAPAAPPAVEAPPPAKCELAIKASPSLYEYEGGGAKGTAKTIDQLKTAIAPLAGKCEAVIAAQKAASYQELIAVLDAVNAAGITKVALDVEGTAKVPTGAGPPKSELKSMPLIVVTKTDVTFDKKKIGKPTDANLDGEVKTALEAAKAAHPGNTFILQADKDTSSAQVLAIVKGASSAGYTEVLFAVKMK